MRPTLRKGEMRGELGDLNPGIAATVPAVQSPDARSRIEGNCVMCAPASLRFDVGGPDELAPVCTENFILIDYVTESSNVSAE